MALYPPAEKRLLPSGVNHSSGGMGTIHGVIVHVIVGPLSAADSKFHNPNLPSNQKSSAHFGVDTNGHVVQWVDTLDKAWAEAAGNPNWISVETAGYPDARLSVQQVEAVAAIVRWASAIHGFPIQLANSPTERGVGTHQMGGAAWGGHACPGNLRAEQRTDIVRIAQGAAPAPAPPKEDEVLYVCHAASGDPTGAKWLTNGLRRRWLRDQPDLDFWLSRSESHVDEAWPYDQLARIPVEPGGEYKP